MKKFISTVCTIVMIICTMSICVQALDDSQINNMSVKYNKLQYTLYKSSNKLRGKSEIEIAKSVLESIGISSNFINQMSEEKLTDIYNSSKVENSETYAYTDSEGNVVISNKEEYEQAIIQADRKGLSEYAAQVNDLSTENNWAKLSTIAIQRDYDHTRYLFFSACEWLTKPIWRGNDFHILWTTEGSIDVSTADAMFFCQQTRFPEGVIAPVCFEYDNNSTSFDTGGRIISFSDNLLNDSSYVTTPGGPASSVTYSDFCSMISVEGNLPTYNVPFNVSSSYYHQWVQALIDTSISFDGISFAIRPGYVYSHIPNNIAVNHIM